MKTSHYLRRSSVPHYTTGGIETLPALDPLPLRSVDALRCLGSQDAYAAWMSRGQ